MTEKTSMTGSVICHTEARQGRAYLILLPVQTLYRHSHGGPQETESPAFDYLQSDQRRDPQGESGSTRLSTHTQPYAEAYVCN